jgi:hypothetical protein
LSALRRGRPVAINFLARAPAGLRQDAASQWFILINRLCIADPGHFDLKAFETDFGAFSDRALSDHADLDLCRRTDAEESD